MRNWSARHYIQLNNCCGYWTLAYAVLSQWKFNHISSRLEQLHWFQIITGVIYKINQQINKVPVFTDQASSCTQLVCCMSMFLELSSEVSLSTMPLPLFGLLSAITDKLFLFFFHAITRDLRLTTRLFINSFCHWPHLLFYGLRLTLGRVTSGMNKTSISSYVEFTVGA